MKKRVILSVVVLAIVIVGSTLLYNNLTDGVRPPNMLGGQQESVLDLSGSTGSSGSSSSPAENTAPEDESAAVDTEASSPDVQGDDRVKAPDFTVEDTEGNAVKLSDMLGKPVVLNFWASWCPPCKSEMPEFNKVFEELGQDIQFMMVDAVDGSRETKRTGEAYIASEGYTFPVYFDIEQDAVIQYGIRAYPTSVFIDNEGYIVAGIEGAIDEVTLRQGIDRIW